MVILVLYHGNKHKAQNMHEKRCQREKTTPKDKERMHGEAMEDTPKKDKKERRQRRARREEAKKGSHENRAKN